MVIAIVSPGRSSYNFVMRLKTITHPQNVRVFSTLDICNDLSNGLKVLEAKVFEETNKVNIHQSSPTGYIEPYLVERFTYKGIVEYTLCPFRVAL